MIDEGSCHRAQIAFEVKGDITGALACHCLILVAINLRCVDDIDLVSISVRNHDARLV